LWDIQNGNLLEIPYDSITAIAAEGGPASGGIAGIKTMAKGGGVVDVGSTYGDVSIQFQHASSLKYGKWLLNEAPKGTELKPGEGTPTIQGKLDPNATPQPPQQKSGCFIATAAYGSPMAKEVVALRRFRDKILSHYRIGREMIEIYYSISPPIAEIINKSRRVRSVTRCLLAPIINFVSALQETNRAKHD
jgi:hypothetical protein